MQQNKGNLIKNSIQFGIRVLAILILIVGIVACGDKPASKDKKKLLAEHKKELKTLKAKIEKLEEEIEKEDPEYGKQKRLRSVTLEPVKKGKFEHFLEVRGNVRSRKNVLVTSEIPATIKKVHVKEGQMVQKGAIMVSLDASTTIQSIEELKTSLSLAKTMYERQENLWKQKIGTEIQYLQAKNQVESLEKKLATANTQLAKAMIKAPFDGIVDELVAKEGEMAQPGMPLLRVVGNKDKYIEADVSEAYVGQFKKGDSVNIYFLSLNESVQATLTAVGQVINDKNRTFSVEVNLTKNNDLHKPNMLAVLKIRDFVSQNSVTVPTNLIQRDMQGKYVYIVDKKEKVKQAKKVHIKIGLDQDQYTVVEEGLDGSEELIKTGFKEVIDGMPVKLAKKIDA